MTITELETRRRQLQRDRDKLLAPGRAAAALQGEIEALDEQIGAERQAAEDARRAAQQRENEIADLQHQLADLREPWRYPAKVETMEQYLWHCERVRARLAQLGIAVEPFSIDVFEAVKPLIEHRERERHAMLASLPKYDPEAAAANDRRRQIIYNLMHDGQMRDSAEANAIADLMEDGNLSQAEAIRRYDGVDDEETEDADSTI